MTEKIFDPEVEKYLKSAGVSEKEINRMKFEAMQKECIKILNEALNCFTGKPKPETLRLLCDYSPAGDEMGCDNNFLDFKNAIGYKEPVDILEAINILTGFYDKQK
jgi:hypothetical protein